MAMAKEEQLILEWVKCRYGNGDMSSLHSLMAECEEQRILQLIDSLRLSGVLFEVFQQLEIRPLIPKTWRDYVEEDMKRIALENQMIEMQGVSLIREFEKEEIPVIWFKGNPNIDWIYQNYTVRSTSDLDFLIRRQDRKRAAELVKRQGFKYPQKTMDTRGVVFSEEELAEWAHEMHYLKETLVLPLNLDLHLDLTGFPQGSIPKSIYHLDDRDWFSACYKKELRGESVPVLRKEDAWIQMIVHFSIHHSFCGMKWLIDLCEVAAFHQESLDWTYLRNEYDHPNERKLMGICFRMVEEITGVDSFGGKPWQYYWASSRAETEYRIYRSFSFEHNKGWRAKIQGRLVKILMPRLARDRWKMFVYYFVSGEAFAQRTGREPGGNFFLNFFSLMKLFVKDHKNRRN